MAHPRGRLEPHHVPIRTGDSPTNPKPAAEEAALRGAQGRWEPTLRQHEFATVAIFRQPITICRLAA